MRALAWSVAALALTPAGAAAESSLAAGEQGPGEAASHHQRTAEADLRGGGERLLAIVRPSSRGAWAARLLAPVSARSGPARGRTVMRLRPVAAWGGGRRQLLVLRSRVTRGRLWLKVLLPRRPNGSSGWIPADVTRLRFSRVRIWIRTERREVRVYRGRRLLRSYRAVVGARSTPTPQGFFAIAEEVRQPDPDRFLGPWVLHLTAFSEVLRRFDGGAGNVGIHGRSGASLRDPLGSARSHGCVRLSNRAVRWLAGVAQPGTPVRITR